MIRVLHVIGAMNRAGAETFIMNVYRSIDRKHVQFDFLVHTSDSCDYDDEIRDLGGCIYHVPKFIGANYFLYRRQVANFFGEHPEHSIVHGHIGSCASIYLSEAKKRGKYTVVHSHSTYRSFSVEQGLHKVLTLNTRHIADYFFACSYQAGLDRFGSSIAGDTGRFAVIKNGIAIDQFTCDFQKHLEAKARLEKDTQVIVGHVGRFEDAKNHFFLLDVFSEIKRIEPRACLLLVGDGSLRSAIEDKVHAKGFADSVIFAGVVPDVHNYLNAMDTFLFPSKYEGLGVALMEAQAAGLPCVVSDAIVDEAIVTPYVRSLSLEEGSLVWARQCLDAAEKREIACENSSEYLQNNGFDIGSVASSLETFYLEHCT